MNRFFCKSALLLFPAILAVPAWAYPQQSASVADSEPKAPADASHASAPVMGHVFAFPVATKSVDAQKLVETALDRYENVLLENSVESARKATEKDPQFALAYAVWSFAARRNQPNPEAARKAESLAATAPADERLLVNFLKRSACAFPQRSSRALPDFGMALFPTGLRPFREDDGANHQTRSKFRACLQHARLCEG